MTRFLQHVAARVLGVVIGVPVGLAVCALWMGGVL